MKKIVFLLIIVMICISSFSFVAAAPAMPSRPVTIEKVAPQHIDEIVGTDYKHIAEFEALDEPMSISIDLDNDGDADFLISDYDNDGDVDIIQIPG